MTILRDALVGQHVVVYVSYHNGATPVILSGPSNPIHTITAIVLEQGPPGSTTLGWKAGQTHPNLYPYSLPITYDWAAIGIVGARQYADHCSCKFVDSESVSNPCVEIGKKKYGNECPCGIHPTICEYHRP